MQVSETELQDIYDKLKKIVELAREITLRLSFEAVVAESRHQSAKKAFLRLEEAVNNLGNLINQDNKEV